MPADAAPATACTAAASGITPSAMMGTDTAGSASWSVTAFATVSTNQVNTRYYMGEFHGLPSLIPSIAASAACDNLVQEFIVTIAEEIKPFELC